ncbi:MAG: RidA family protein [Pseudomonadota bacterium]
MHSNSVPRRRLLKGLAGIAALGAGGASMTVRGQTDRTAAARLEALDITLPRLSPAVASYVPYVVDGNEVYISGQLPFRDGALLYPGKIPEDVTVDQGLEAARQCAINILSALNAACDGDLDRVERCLRLEGYVACSDAFTQQSAVVNGASDLMQAVFGERGRHTRIAVGANSLPLNACVEVAGLFRIRT